MDKDTLTARLQKVQKLSSVRAHAPAATPFDASGESPSLDTTGTPALASATAQADLRSFAEAGWSIKREGDEPGGLEVVVDGDGHIKMLGPTLNVKFAADVADAAREALLERHALTVRRRIGAAGAVYLVNATAGDALGAARALNQEAGVEWAEPVFIEALSSR